MRASDVRRLRETLGLTQQAFASLLGFSFVSINKWENGGSRPTGLGPVILQLLKGALLYHSPQIIIRELRRTTSDPVEVVRTLARLEGKAR